ncbi:YceK/YidQ family lipoprotein [Pseudomonas paraeruginosa]|uniref:YceK/YidQ family lipoprotein n=1 Tax=Pseudomonas paraeruginosa TaxID=2994495 RepID=UPI0039FC8435|nr:YceK/YidQ family lipoprotein [Pseudomonas aeruginosa]HBP5564608.1 YceK/YidQ family lipoprotein [Pseudomonas aeruginosa]HCF2411942.1 YceK/YidQ family lipoprotein [Pseudomonas aeruginosa]
MFRSGLSLLILLGAAALGGCGSVNTLARGDASAAHDLRLQNTACSSLPRVYSGVSYNFCRLNVKTGSPVAPAQSDGILEVLALDFALSGVIDTLVLPYTSYRQYRDGNLSLAD